MIRIGICDDESRAREALKIQLEQLLREEDAKVIYEFSSGEGLCAWLPKHAGELDLLFLDVEMGGMNGMETARRIRQSDNGLLIVFVTGYADFVFDGYSVQALDYVMKPVKRERLAQLMERVEEQLRRRSPQTLTIQNTEGLFRVAYRGYPLLLQRPAPSHRCDPGPGISLLCQAGRRGPDPGGRLRSHPSAVSGACKSRGLPSKAARCASGQTGCPSAAACGSKLWRS